MFPLFWDACYADGSVKELESLASDFTYMYGICYDNPDKSEKRFAYSIAVESEKKAPAGYRKTVIPARTWAVFPCKGSVSHSIADFWAKTFPEFARNADYVPYEKWISRHIPTGIRTARNTFVKFG